MSTHVSVLEYARRHGCSRQAVTGWCRAGKIPGAQRVGAAWILPRAALDAPPPRGKPGRPMKTH